MAPREERWGKREGHRERGVIKYPHRGAPLYALAGWGRRRRVLIGLKGNCRAEAPPGVGGGETMEESKIRENFAAEVHRAEERVERQKEELARADDEVRRGAAEIVQANRKPVVDLDIDLGS